MGFCVYFLFFLCLFLKQLGSKHFRNLKRFLIGGLCCVGFIQSVTIETTFEKTFCSYTTNNALVWVVSLSWEIPKEFKSNRRQQNL